MWEKNLFVGTLSSMPQKAGTYTLRELMVQVFSKGNCVYTSPKTMEIRDYCLQEQDTLWEETRRLVNPHKVYVDLSDKLYQTKIDLLNEMGQARAHL